MKGEARGGNASKPPGLLRMLSVTSRAIVADPVGSRPARRVVSAVVRALPGTDAAIFLRTRGAAPLARIAAAGNGAFSGAAVAGDGVADLLTIAFTRHRPVTAGCDRGVALCHSWRQAGVTWAAAAVLRSQRRALGGLVVRGRFGDAPDEAALWFIEGMADLGALGLLARGASAPDRETGEATAVLDALLRCQEAERARIARELHDEANQSIVSLVLGLSLLEKSAGSPSACEQIACLRERALGVLDALRRVARGLRPPALDELGLGPALRALCEDFTATYGIAAQFFHVEVECPCRSRAIDTALYRIAQEALTNVARHSGASQVAVILSCRNGLVTVQVEDDGKGAPPEGDRLSPTCLGLLGMRERAGLLGGRVRVESSPGLGTTVYAEIPADFVEEGSEDDGADPLVDR